MQHWFPLLPTIGQALIGFYFAFFGFWNIYHWTPLLQTMIQKNIPHAFFLLSIGIMWQIVTGTMIMFGIYVKVAALLLIPFTIISICIFHSFWTQTGEHKRLNLNIFIANLTVTLGALLHLLTNAVQVSQVTQQLTA
jgi:putative oxidoreductase